MKSLQYDHIVVGAGSTGSVIASRLSEDSHRRVLLVEAGPDYTGGDIPSALLDSRVAVMNAYNWNAEAFVREESTVSALRRAGSIFSVASNRIRLTKAALKARVNSSNALMTRINYPLGKLVGGSSAINGALAFHAAPEDYNEWAGLGNDWWAWKNVRPFCRLVYDDQTSGGSIPVEIAGLEHYTCAQRAFVEACESIDIPVIEPEHLQRNVGGVGGIPKNTRSGYRVSSASVYLSEVKRRPNLTVLPLCTVDKLNLDVHDSKVRVLGIEVLHNHKRESIFSGHVILSAGAIHSPAILLRSGIGSQEDLAKLGVEQRIDLPGVGKNLMDHPSVGLWAVPKTGVCNLGEPLHQVMLRQTAAGSGYINDLQLYMLSAVDTKLFPPLADITAASVAMAVSVVLAKPRSRGYLKLSSRDPTLSPDIYLNCAKNADDLARLTHGVRLAWRILQQRPLLEKVARMVMWNQNLIDSDRQIENLILSSVRASWHPAGTLRMGRREDRMSVVDQYGQLHGCENLTVADASIMPTLPGMPTNLTCMTIGEKIASHIRSHHL